MALLHHAGYHTVTLAQVDDYVAGRPEKLTSRPSLITFDDGLASSWIDGDGALEREGFTATIFIDAGRVNSDAAGYLTWDELKKMRAGGRWDVQLHAWTGTGFIRDRYTRYGPGKDDYGAFYAYREEGESLEGWRKRVFGDISEGAAALRERSLDEQALAFAPPYGNYGPEGTNDAAIPGELLAWLLERYRIVFVQDRSMFTEPREKQPLGRLQITRSMTGGELQAKLSGPG
jgi:peptidoglycan/xylan/chitin deacetylase (PgdA/CDA1 family)